MSKFLHLLNVAFKYDDSPEYIFKNVNLHFPIGWTGIVGANGSGKTTLLKLSSKLLTPTSGSIKSYGTTYYCDQRTDTLPSFYRQFVASFEKESFKILNLLGVDPEMFNRWKTLSHGERKRCQIATALFANPDILVIDEPTNHIDNKCREILVNALGTFKGIGLIVTHDRELLNILCSNIVSLMENGYKHFQGNYNVYEQEMDKEFKNLVNVRDSLTKEIMRIEKEVKIRKRKATESDKRISKRKISSKDHDAKSRIDSARLTGKDAVDGKKYFQLKSRMNKMISKKNSLGSAAKRELGVDLRGEKYSKSTIIYHKGGRLYLGNGNALVYPDLHIKSEDKIGIVGNNGFGKSSLIKEIIKSIQGNIILYTYIPQEITSEQSEILLRNSFDLSHEDKGKIFTIISRLNSDPKRLLDSKLPSPGEVRKLMLATAILKKHNLIIMDEPTNHMDLPSIKCVEKALKNYKGSLILVSHDIIFLNNIVQTIWKIRLYNQSHLKLNINTVTSNE